MKRKKLLAAALSAALAVSSMAVPVFAASATAEAPYTTTFDDGVLKYAIIDKGTWVDETCAAVIDTAAEGLVDVTIPETVTYDGTEYAVKEILGQAFVNETTIESVAIPDSVEGVGEIPGFVIDHFYISGGVFTGCTSLKNVKLPDNPKNDILSMGLFTGCTSLKSVTIPDSVTKIEIMAFDSSGLENITIPSSVKEIEGMAFSNCENLKTVTFLHQGDDPFTMFTGNYPELPLTGAATERTYMFGKGSGNVKIITENENVKGQITELAQNVANQYKDGSGKIPDRNKEAAKTAAGFEIENNSDGTAVDVTQSVNDATVDPTDSESSASKAVIELFPVSGTSSEYSIVVKPVADTEKETEKDTFNFTAIEFDFTNTPAEGAAGAELVPAKNMSIVKDTFITDTDPEENTYSIYVNPEAGAETKTGSIIVGPEGVTIGTIKLTGVGTGAVKIAGGIVRTELADSIVRDITAEKAADAGDDDYNASTDYDVDLEKAKLTVNVQFPNTVDEQSTAYTAMKVAIASVIDTKPVVELGKSGAEEPTVTYTKASNVDGAVTYASYSFKTDVYTDTRYTLTFSGEGYRTYSLDVVIPAGSKDAAVNVWNNVMDDPGKAEVVIDGKTTKTETVTFLAGDIDNSQYIDLYDLSSAVAYFGKDNRTDVDGVPTATDTEYNRYDLNRDGLIDSKDIAMVLVSWNK